MTRRAETTTRLTLAAAAMMGLAGCSWFGGDSRQAATTPPPPAQVQSTPTAPVAQATIRDVQTGLQQAGYYKNQHVDGVWGPRTERAVKRFQHDHNLTANGKLDVPTLQALNIAGAPPSTAPGNNASANSPPADQTAPADNAPANASSPNYPGPDTNPAPTNR